MKMPRVVKCKRCSTPLDDSDRFFFDYFSELGRKTKRHEEEYRRAVHCLSEVRSALHDEREKLKELRQRNRDLVANLTDPGGIFHSLNQRMIQADFCASALEAMKAERADRS